MMRQFLSPAARRRMHAEGGLSLIEIIIAGFVLSIAVLGLASVASASLVSIRDARERDRAAAAASSAIETARALSFEHVALTGTAWQTDDAVSAAGGTWLLDHNDDGQFTEEIIATPGGRIDPYICDSASTDCWFAMPAGTRVQVQTFVSRHDDMPLHFARRVTVVAVWDDPSFTTPRVVRMSTVISQADRGLPAPRFEVLPQTLFTRVDQFFVDSFEWHCFKHVVTNLGVSDSYEIHLPMSEDWLLADAVAGEFYNTSKPWRFGAYFVRDGEELGTSTRMSVVGADRLVSPSSLDTGETAQIHMCYRARDNDNQPATGNVYEFSHAVRSAFDHEIQASVEHEIEVGALTQLQLHYGSYDVLNPEDPEDDWEFEWEHRHDGVYTRPVAGFTSGVVRFESLPMLPFGNLPNRSMPAYDAHIHHDGLNYRNADGQLTGRLSLDGMFLPRSDTEFSSDPIPPDAEGVTQPRSAFSIVWDWQFNNDTAPLTFTGVSELFISARRSTPVDAAPPFAQFCVQAELLKYAMQPDGSLSTSPTVVGSGAVDASGTSGAWTQLPSLSMPWQIDGSPSSVSFEPGDVLRLRLENRGAPHSANCVRFHVGFGVQGFPSRLEFSP